MAVAGASSSSAVKRPEFILISNDAAWIQRCETLSREFHFGFLAMDSINGLLDKKNDISLAKFILISAVQTSQQEEIAGSVQVARQACFTAQICVAIDKKLPPELASFVKKSGANFVILENEFFESSKIEFFSSQTIRASLIPVKIHDFDKGSALDFDLFHLLPLNQKILPALQKGTELNESRFVKLESVAELYIRREDLDKYSEYLKTHPDSSVQGVLRRCRATYLNLCAEHTGLMNLLSDQSESASFEAGKKLIDHCRQLSMELLSSLVVVGEAWDVVNNASLGEFGYVERLPALASYAGLMSLMTGIGDPVEVMSSVLLSDVGLLETPARVLSELRSTPDSDQLSTNARVEYEKHPLLSISRCLARRLPLSEDMKTMILQSHERLDRKGFPHQPEPHKIVLSAQLIQFCDIVDQTCLLNMGQKRRPLSEIRREVFEHHIDKRTHFSTDFMLKVKPQMIPV